MKIRIVSDSAADIPPELVEKYDIRIIPAYIHFGTEESLRDDGISITKDVFYQRLKTANPLPTTSAPAPGESEAILREALVGMEHVIAIHTAKALSGIISSSEIAAQQIGTDKITVLDGGGLSMGIGWQAVVAAELAAQNANLKTILDKVESTKSRSKLWAVPATMDYLRRSGRVNNLVASLGELLQLKPIIGVSKSQVYSDGRVRTFKKVIPKLVELAKEHAPLERLAILHIDNPEGAEEMRLALQTLAPQAYVVYASAAIGANFGPGGLGLALVTQ